MFNRKAWLGQVPLARAYSMDRTSRPSAGHSLREGDEIQANGGKIVKRIGFLWFYPDEEALDKIEAATGDRPPESIEARIKHCNKLPGTFPGFGEFRDPSTGYICWIHLPEGWNDAWMGWDRLI